jgi:hypothetical protein
MASRISAVCGIIRAFPTLRGTATDAEEEPPDVRRKARARFLYRRGREVVSRAPRLDYTAYCLPWGYTRAGGTEYPIEIIQKPNRLAFLFESNNIFHVVPTDGRDHPKDFAPNWLGNSIGRWEGDTLVIDTVGFNGKTNIDTAGHPVERGSASRRTDQL